MAIQARYDWVAIRRLYEEDDKTVAQIMSETGASESAIYQHRKLEGWASRAEKRLIARTSVVPAPRMIPLDEMLQKLSRLASRNLTILEKIMDNDDAMSSPADADRTTRAMGGATRAIEKIAELASANGQHPGAGPERPGLPDFAADAERIRREIAERLERLEAKRRAR